MMLKQGEPHSFGWLRRSEFDQNGAQAFEKPDGQIHLFPPGRWPSLTVCVDMARGDDVTVEMTVKGLPDGRIEIVEIKTRDRE